MIIKHRYIIYPTNKPPSICQMPPRILTGEDPQHLSEDPEVLKNRDIL